MGKRHSQNPFPSKPDWTTGQHSRWCPTHIGYSHISITDTTFLSLHLSLRLLSRLSLHLSSHLSLHLSSPLCLRRWSSFGLTLVVVRTRRKGKTPRFAQRETSSVRFSVRTC